MKNIDWSLECSYTVLWIKHCEFLLADHRLVTTNRGKPTRHIQDCVTGFEITWTEYQFESFQPSSYSIDSAQEALSKQAKQSQSTCPCKHTRGRKRGKMMEVLNPREDGRGIMYVYCPWTCEQMTSVASEFPDKCSQGGHEYVIILH